MLPMRAVATSTRIETITAGLEASTPTTTKVDFKHELRELYAPGREPVTLTCVSWLTC